MLNAALASAQWTQVADNDDAIVYTDASTMMRSANIATMWQVNDLKVARQTLITMSAGSAYQSTKLQREYDCHAATMRTLLFTAHAGKMGSGNVVLSDADATPWVDVSRDGNDALLLNMALTRS